MCVALPGRVVSIEAPEGPSRPATVRFGEATRRVDLAMVPDAAVGDFVIVHSGFAISRVTAAEARHTESLLADAAPR